MVMDKQFVLADRTSGIGKAVVCFLVREGWTDGVEGRRVGLLFTMMIDAEFTQ